MLTSLSDLVKVYGAPAIPMLPIPRFGGRYWFIDNASGTNGDGKDPDFAFGSFAAGITNNNNLRTGDVVCVIGDITEQSVSTPASIKFVTVVGMGAHQRASRWMGSNVAASYITVNNIGWIFENLYFAGGTAGYSITFQRDATNNASEGRVINCVLNGGSGGIQNVGGCSNMHYLGNRFINIRGGTAADPGAIILASTAQAVPSNCEVAGNRFYNCGKMLAHGMMRSRVAYNEFQAIGNDGTATEVLNLNYETGSRDGAGGVYNWAFMNYLGNTNANITKANGYIGGANSQWPNNYATDQVNTTLPT